MKKSQTLPRFIIRAFVFLCMALILFGIFSLPALATSGRTEVAGNVYEFGKDSHYEFHEDNAFTSSKSCDTYGTFSISGNIANISNRDGVPSYEVSDGSLALFYNYGDATLNADVDSWHLIEDKSKKVADMTLGANIMKGAIIL
ncbi:lipocalin family protein, partial [uncultured Bacteroides sp.]|uniref:lipocalin family protein n=1 Tax=uncultured Bacteroides sp. TaxID=162156 RepID=UPI00259B33E4